VNSGRFDRSRLPAAIAYFTEREQLRLFGRGVWRSAHCPLHDDLQPSLRVNLDVGAFRCMACGALEETQGAFDRRPEWVDA
jgi:hypothetical protein